MHAHATRPTALRPRSGIRLAVAIATSTLVCLALTTPAAATSSSARQSAPRAHNAAVGRHLTSGTTLLRELRVRAGHHHRTVARPRTTAGSGATLCVGRAPGCFPTIQSALDAAHDGDTIRVGRGTFAGGITITKTVNVVGVGAESTIIKGGGPAVTIGTFGAPSEPTVLIDGITVTGGVTHSSPLSDDGVGKANVIALGGGIEIAPAVDFTTGATVTIRHSLITGNHAIPTDSVPSGLPCPDGECAFAWARGGGIDNWGTLTLVDTMVSNNTAAGTASDANGGGINSWDTSSLTLRHSRIIGNHALASIPNGRFAEGGGIFTDSGIEVSIHDSVFLDNSASLVSRLPYLVPGANPLELNANGGGVHVGDGCTVTIDDTIFRGNVAAVSDPNGQPVVLDAAVHPGDGRLVLRDSTIADNLTFANVASTADVGPSGSAIDVAGLSTITRTRITGNKTVVISHSGAAAATAGGVYAFGTVPQPMEISDSVISDNSAIAWSKGGPASVFGGGMVNDGRLVLSDDVIANNIGIVHGTTGLAQGGGIWNGKMFGQPPFELTLIRTSVTGNRLRGTSGITLQGGGLFTMFPVTILQSQIAGNSPDDCFGCLDDGSVALPRFAISRAGR